MSLETTQQAGRREEALKLWLEALETARSDYERTVAERYVNSIRLEINGSRGSLAFDFEDMNVLHFYDETEPAETAGFRRILVTEPTHPYVGAWWPPGHVLGYEHGFTHQVVDLVTAIAEDRQPLPSFADGLQVQTVLDAVERSAETGTWQNVTASATVAGGRTGGIR